MPVPQTGHFPLTAGRPFFIVTFCSSFISVDFLHFTQYPVSAISSSPFIFSRFTYRHYDSGRSEEQVISLLQIYCYLLYTMTPKMQLFTFLSMPTALIMGRDIPLFLDFSDD